MTPEYWKPEGYTQVAPYLIVDGAQQVIDFVKAAFGADELRRFDAPDRGIIHAEVRIGDTVVMLADPGADWPAYRSQVHVYLPDVDAAFEAALRAGGRAIQEPAQRDGDPDRRGGVEDPAGTTWWIATQQVGDQR